jgi:NSS family neurotransmitter:Na+ symporter
MMGIIVTYSLTLNGAHLGLATLFTPNYTDILNPRLWIAAVTQILFSLSIGEGVLIAYASYLPKKKKQILLKVPSLLLVQTVDLNCLQR